MKKYNLILTEKCESKQTRISPQLSCTLDENNIQFINDLTIHYTNKHKKVFNVSQTVRCILKYCKQNESELKDFI